MATIKDKAQLNVWLDPEIEEKPRDFHRKYAKLFPKQGGYAKAVEMIIEKGVKSASQECDELLKKLKEAK